MANRKTNPKTKDGFFHALSVKCSSFAGLLVFSMLALNLAVVFFFEKSRSPQIVYSVERVFVNTNVNSTVVSVSDSPAEAVSSPSSPSNNLGVASSDHKQDLIRLSTPYDYFTYDFRRFAKMFDRLFSEGSLTSYGRIVVIFPDRILLDDGSYICNSHWSSFQSVNSAVQGGKIP